MIQIVIFSFNRALQLEALLSSINKYWKKTESKVSILYNTTGGDFQKGYDLLQTEYPSYEFLKEQKHCSFFNFRDYLSVFNLKKMLKYRHMRKQKSNFRDLLNDILAKSKCEYTMFLTDDSVFIKDVVLTKEELQFISHNPIQNQISLRLGKQITECPKSIPVCNGKLEWNFDEHRNAKSWGYNFSVDAHIYSTSVCNQLFQRIIFSNPTTLEDTICSYVRQHNLFNHGITFEEPFILSFPINMVQEIADNESLHISVEDLNNYFLDGKRLEYIIPDQIVEFQQYPDSIILNKEGVKEILTTKSRL